MEKFFQFLLLMLFITATNAMGFYIITSTITQLFHTIYASGWGLNEYISGGLSISVIQVMIKEVRNG